MPVSKEFIQAWHKWRKFRSSYSRNHFLHRTVAGVVTLDLDHMESYLYSIGLSIMEGKNYRYAEIASRELSDLQKINLELESYDITESEKEVFRDNIRIIRAVWLAIQKPGFKDSVSSSEY